MDQQRITGLACVLYYAEQMHFQIPALSKVFPEITEEDGYRIQAQLIEKYARSGMACAGKKAGGISYRKNASGGYGPHYGQLLESKIHKSGETIPMGAFFSPGLEAEVAVILNRDLCEGEITVETARQAIGYLVPALEIVDSRQLRDGKTMPASLADNASSGGCVLGEKKISVSQLRPDQRFTVRMEENGTGLECEAGEADLEALAGTICWLANKLIAAGSGLRAGEVIMTGALTFPLQSVKKNNSYSADFPELGKVTIQFV